jgi:adenylate cyclase
MHRTLSSFSKFVPLNVVRMLVSSGSEAELFCEPKYMTFFFSDIADFTKISEKLDLDDLMLVLRFAFVNF